MAEEGQLEEKSVLEISWIFPAFFRNPVQMILQRILVDKKSVGCIFQRHIAGEICPQYGTLLFPQSV